MYYLVNLIVEVPVKANSKKEAADIAKWAMKQELKQGCNIDYQYVDSAIEYDEAEAEGLDFYTGELLTMAVSQKDEE